MCMCVWVCMWTCLWVCVLVHVRLLVCMNGILLNASQSGWNNIIYIVYCLYCCISYSYNFYDTSSRGMYTISIHSFVVFWQKVDSYCFLYFCSLLPFFVFSVSKRAHSIASFIHRPTLILNYFYKLYPLGCLHFLRSPEPDIK